jgi:hypothetical protein
MPVWVQLLFSIVKARPPNIPGRCFEVLKYMFWLELDATVHKSEFCPIAVHFCP